MVKRDVIRFAQKSKYLLLTCEAWYTIKLHVSIQLGTLITDRITADVVHKARNIYFKLK